jgi:hypothetical protein
MYAFEIDLIRHNIQHEVSPECETLAQFVLIKVDKQPFTQAHEFKMKVAVNTKRRIITLETAPNSLQQLVFTSGNKLSI